MPSSLCRDNSPSREEQANETPAVLFDLDGTLVDSNYEHITAWRLAFRRADIEVPNAFLHRSIGMRGDLLIRAAYKEMGKKAPGVAVAKLSKFHKDYLEKTLPSVKALPGAAALLKVLSRRKVPWAIGTGGDKSAVVKMIRLLEYRRMHQ